MTTTDHPLTEAADIPDLARRVLGADKVGGDLTNAAAWDAVDLVLENAPTLARAVLAVADLHRPVKVYDECENEDCENEHVELMDYRGCESTVIGWACAICCYDEGHPLECRDHRGHHAHVPPGQACATHETLARIRAQADAATDVAEGDA